MSRNLKIAPENFYHIFNRGTEKRLIFLDERDYERFVGLMHLCNSEEKIRLDFFDKSVPLKELLKFHIENRIVSIGAYCLMPNHFHILIKEIVEGGISKFMQKFMTGYVMYFNSKYERSGTLFQGRFKAEHANEDTYLKYLYTYINLNPIGIIDKGWKNKHLENKFEAKKFLESYPYSSYLDYTNNLRDEGIILDKSKFPEYFETPKKFDEMVNEWINFEDL